MSAVDALLRVCAVDYYLNALTESADVWSIDDAVRVLIGAEEISDRIRQICAHLEGMLREADAEAA